MSAYLDVSGLADENSRIVARRKRAEQKLERDKEEVLETRASSRLAIFCELSELLRMQEQN